ncbi:MAG: hypothetical protein LC808_33680 [Actinobacteria bacterium]|nr:hypothetical protein [Actinomycetota bacterium]
MRRREQAVLGLRLVAMVAVVALFAGACSKDAETTASAPEDKRATPAEVAAGLRRIDGIARDVAAQAGVDKAKAATTDAQIEAQWAAIEGTVKANDKNAYLGFEDNFALLQEAAKSGDAARAAEGSAGVSKGVTDYLASYPG